MKFRGIAALVLIAALGVVPGTSHAQGRGGLKSNLEAYGPSLSGDGRLLTFYSSAFNFVPDDPEYFSDVYVRDLESGSTLLVSRATGAAGANSNGGAYRSVISADGRRVAFVSTASNLSPDVPPTNSTAHVYVRDLDTSVTTLASRPDGASGTPSLSRSDYPSISDDGRYVAFESAAKLSPADLDDRNDVYVRDLQTNTTTLASVAVPDPPPATDDRATPALSGNGRFVAFTSFDHVYVRDLLLNTTIVAGAWPVTPVSISGDGHYVAYASYVPETAEDIDERADVYIRDTQTNNVTLASRASGSAGPKGNDWSDSPRLTADGRAIAFSSVATNFADDGDPTRDIFVRDLQANTTVLVSRATGVEGTKGNADSVEPAIAADGRYVGFESRSTNLSPFDRDSRPDVYVRDMQDSITTVESRGTEYYPRPRAATPLHAPLVPAFAECTTPNRVHAPPLGFDSCNPPVQTSTLLTVGEATSNGAAANSTASAHLVIQPDDANTPAVDETDLLIRVSATDVREQGTLADYSGETELRASVRVTDRAGAVPGEPATVSDFDVGAGVPCTATADPAIGSTCSLATSIDTLLPGAAAARSRAIWEFGALDLYDGGADGDGDTAAGNTVFLTQGVFVP